MVHQYVTIKKVYSLDGMLFSFFLMAYYIIVHNNWQDTIWLIIISFYYFNRMYSRFNAVAKKGRQFLCHEIIGVFNQRVLNSLVFKLIKHSVNPNR